MTFPAAAGADLQGVHSASRPTVSIVVPAYNIEAFLADALESVLAQTYGDWECVVVDDGSVDRTAEVGAAYAARDERIRVLARPHAGLSAARNAGISATRGPYLQFLDGDDRLAPFKLAEHVRFLDEHGECDVVYGNVAFFRSDSPDRLMPSPGGRLSRPVLDDRVHGVSEALRKFEHFNFFHIGSALSRRSAIEKAGRFTETTRASGEDHELWIRCAVVGCRFDHWERGEPVLLVRSRPTSSSRTRGQVVRGMIDAATTFRSTAAAPFWQRETLPLIYEVALGIRDAEQGRRLNGFRRIWAAASAATEALTALRWRAYAIAALLLPGRMFFAFVSLPVPESALEYYRVWRRLLARMRGSS